MDNPQDDTTLYLASNPSDRIDMFASLVSIITFPEEGPGDSAGTPKAATKPDRPEGTSVGIHLLPQELLVLIFEVFVGLDTPVQNLVTLTLVCKQWEQIVEGTPRLWRCISGKEALSRVQRALVMAKDVPLEIDYSEETAKIGSKTFFAEIGGRIAHWRSLVVTTDNPEPAVAILKVAVAPNLKTVRLFCEWGRQWDNRQFTLFRGEQAPLALKDFHIRSIPVVVEPLRLSGLQFLDLREHPIISAEEVLRVLSVSPVLERCSLQHLVCLKDFALPGYKQEFLALQGFENTTIQLSCLRNLVLVGLPVSFVHLLLSIIRAPNLGWCMLDCKIDRHDQSPRSELLTAHISHLIPALTALTSKAEEIEIASFDGNDFTFQVGQFAIGNMGGALERKHLDETLEWLCDCLGGHVKALPLSLVLFKVNVNSIWFSWLASTPRVTKLGLWTDPFSGPRDIISLLTQPLVSAPTQWLFPELESIGTIVARSYAKSKILEMVKARHSFIEAQRKDAGHSVLKPFKEIILRSGSYSISKEISRHAEFLNALQEAAKDAEIWWEDIKWTGNGNSSF
ncbi:hypothetical protein FS837_011408 [Tulasnella sp. UAMH 9824]|nr:hypothetical protein FS837_011408 [Tulasnella sp. UAMH 9824]